MSAAYPTSAKAFTTKVDGAGNTILAAHINDLQAEVTAVETDLIAGLPVARGGTGLTTIGAAGTVLSSDGAVASWGAAARIEPCGRLTLTSGTPVTTADVTAAGTLYYALYKGNQIPLYTGSAWVLSTIAELSVAVPAAANQVYDAFVDYNSGTPALTLTAWTNDTTRATALTTQNGVYVLTGSPGKRYVGTVRTVTASQLNDSVLLRHVWNYYHRVPRPLLRQEATATWNYTTATWRQANAAAANQVDVVIGVAEALLDVRAEITVSNSNSSVGVSVGIGEDSTTAPVSTQVGGSWFTLVGSYAQLAASVRKYPAVGRHYYAWLEYSAATGTTSWWATGNFVTGVTNSGIHGWIEG